MGSATTSDYRHHRDQNLAVTSIRTDRATLEAFKRVAAANHRTVSQQLRWLIEQDIANAKRLEEAA